MPVSFDRYGSDVLSGTNPAPVPHRRRPVSRPLPAERGLVVEDVETGWVGAVVRVEKSGGMHVVVLEDRARRTRTFPLGPGFWVDGEPVELTAPVTSRAPAAPTRTASGSRAVANVRARVARGSRIWVEGKHDAELVEKVWGDDLRIEGVVVELLDGVDNLAEALKDFGPTAERKVGVLVDHLVPGSKETRLVSEALHLESFRRGLCPPRGRRRSPVLPTLRTTAPPPTRAGVPSSSRALRRSRPRPATCRPDGAGNPGCAPSVLPVDARTTASCARRKD